MENHIDYVSKTISRNISVMNKLKHFVPTRILHCLYCTLVLPYLNYGPIIGYNTSRALADILAPLVGKTDYHVENSKRHG